VSGFTNPAGTPDVFAFSTAHDGAAAGGAQIGVNWQAGRWVFGVEADYMRTDLARTVVGPGSAVFGSEASFAFRNAWQASIRARLGFAVDRWLLYASAGPAWSDLSVTGAYQPRTFRSPPAGPNLPPPPDVVIPGSSASDHQILFGGSVGVGLEYALTPNLSAAFDYRYSFYGSKTFALGGLLFPNNETSAVTISATEPTSVINARLNFRFGDS
jgi:outer membrane immunogenic protein